MISYVFNCQYGYVIDSHLETTNTIKSEYYFHGYDSIDPDKYEHLPEKYECDYLTHDFLHALIRANSYYYLNNKTFDFFMCKPRIGVYDKNKEMIGIVYDLDVPLNQMFYKTFENRLYSESQEATRIAQNYFNKFTKEDIIKLILGKQAFCYTLSCDYENLSNMFKTSDINKINKIINKNKINVLDYYDIQESGKNCQLLLPKDRGL